MKRESKKPSTPLEAQSRKARSGQQISYPKFLSHFTQKEFRAGILHPSVTSEKPEKARLKPQIPYVQNLNRFGDKGFRGGRSSEKKGDGNA